MGVDLSTTIAVGFAIDPALFKAYREKVDPEGNLAGEEIFYESDLKNWSDAYDYGEAGSYYGSDDLQPYICLRRSRKSYDQYDLPGGLFGVNRPTITLEEREGFNAIAAELGMSEPEIGQFLAVLWH